MKGQIRMFETIAVLVVFFFLPVTGISFYFGAQKSSIEKERVRLVELSALQSALRVLHLPDLDCSVLGARSENCIDTLKLEIFSDMLKDENIALDYFEGFGFANISVRQAWPCPDLNGFCGGMVLYDNPPINSEGKVSYSYATKTLSPVLLYDAWHDLHYFGVVEVTSYVA